MRWLLFLSRLAFICGVCFLLSLSLLITEKSWIKDESMISTIITIGFFMGMIVVPITLLCYLIVWIAGKRPGRVVPKWLIIGNIFALLLLAGYIIYKNQFAEQMPL